MRNLGLVLLAAVTLLVPGTARAVLFDFDNAPPMTNLPIDLTVGGITAHLSATGQGFSVQSAGFMGFTPAGFAGYCIAPNSVYAADLLVSFSQTLSDFSIMYSPQELGCDDSATMRITAYMNANYVGTNTATAPAPGTWPTGTLTFSSTLGFNNVVVHYDSRPPTCQDYGMIFMADNMNVTAMPVSSIGSGIEAAQRVPLVSPNPFGRETTVWFDPVRAGPVSITVYDAQGRLVRSLLAETVSQSGIRGVHWDGRDDSGREAMSGVYLCRVQTAERATATRMVLLRGR